MSDERAMSEDDIETMAWELETKMMEIRKDPRAALWAVEGRFTAKALHVGPFVGLASPLVRFPEGGRYLGTWEKCFH